LTVEERVACQNHSVAIQTIETPDGPFTIVANSDFVLASGWTSHVDELIALIHPILRDAEPDIAGGLMPTISPVTGPARIGPEPVSSRSSAISAAVDAVYAYYNGDLAAIDAVPVIQRSGPFRTHAWDVLRHVAPGSPVTYSEYATRSGNPAAVRAAAAACAKNAAALFVPCHRVLRSDGSLGGFRYGLAIKQSLLTREASTG
jgi:methylated-DNA-[protein]-cysteine S-methyltransferase